MLTFCASAATAAVPQLWLGHSTPRVNLTESMETLRLPAAAPIDPDALWEGAGGTPVARSTRWPVIDGERVVGRVTLIGSRERDTYVVQVPVAWVDEVQVWYREQGNAWKGAVAGDLVPLSRWPYAGPYPAFPILVREEALDVMVTVRNSGPLEVPVWVMPDAAFRAHQLRQANLSGLVMGLAAMVTVVCVIGGAILRRRANWLLAGVAAWGLITVVSTNGYLAVWLTPDWPAFNDASKHFSSAVLGGLMVLIVGDSLDQRFLGRTQHFLKWAAPAFGLAYASVQAAWLPPEWRQEGGLAWAAFTLPICVGMCAVNALRGGRHVGWISAAVACYALALLAAFVRTDFAGGLDMRSVATGLLLFASFLLLRQALFARERYGRDVLGRAAISANRDPLTALLSYAGFQQAFDEVVLKQGAGHHEPTVILFLLPGLEKSAADHGFVLTERALVRFAASLQAMLGDAWSIARLSKTRFACIALRPLDRKGLQDLVTQVLTRCTRLSEPLGPVSDFDLKIAATPCAQVTAGLKELLQEMEHAVLALEPGKRIVVL